jgi:hypothetical protein
LREKSGKKVGGQPGYKGNYRPQYDRPDEVVKHPVAACGIAAKVGCKRRFKK